MGISLATLLPALLLGLAALITLLFLASGILTGILALCGKPRPNGFWRGGSFFSLSGLLQQLRLRQRAKLLTALAEALQQEHFGKAQRLWQQFLKDSANTRNFYEDGLEILQVALRYSDTHGTRLVNLALMEELLLQRPNLTKKLAEARYCLKRHQQSTKESGRAWAAAELSSKIEESQKQLDLNHTRLLSEFTKLLENLRSQTQPETFTVH